MAINIVKKLISVIMVLELVMMATATLRINGVHEENISPTCILLCGAECKDKGILAPVCFVKCLFNCKMDPAVSDDVKMCASNCAQSTCSKFVEDMSLLEKCVIDECVQKCMDQSGN